MPNNTKGITLVALIITIVILIILTAIVIKIAVDTKILQIAGNGTENYVQAQEKEIEETSKFANFLTKVINSISGKQDDESDKKPEEDEKDKEDEDKIESVEGYITDNLILHYDGINNTGKGHSSDVTTWKDLSGNNRDGTLNGCTWETDCITLDGKLDGIFLDNKLIDLLKNDHTIEFCIYYADDKRSIFIGNYDTESHNSEYWRETGHQFRTWWDNGQISSAWTQVFLNTAEKQTITIKLEKSSNKVQVYRDGNLIETRTDARYGSYNYDWTKVWIGRDNNNNSTRGLNGKIYSVRIYDRLLNDTEIKKNSENDLSRFNFSAKPVNRTYANSGLMLHYDGINNTGNGHSSSATTWKDLSGNNRNGTLTGCTWGNDCIILDGTTDGIYLGNQLINLLKNDHTIEFCIYYADDKRSIFIGNYDTESHNSEYWRETGHQFRTWWDNGQISSAWTQVFLNTAEIQTVTIRLEKSSNKVEVYKNGQLIETRTDARYGSYNYDWTKVWIGRDNYNTSTRGLNGRIYSVRVYNRLLNDNEIQSNYLLDKANFNM